MDANNQPKRMSFYATTNDQATIEDIQKLCPHYTFNFIVREGMRLLKQSLQTSSPIQLPKQRVEYTTTPRPALPRLSWEGQ